MSLRGLEALAELLSGDGSIGEVRILTPESMAELPVIKAAKNLVIEIAALPIKAAMITLVDALADIVIPDA